MTPLKTTIKSRFLIKQAQEAYVATPESILTRIDQVLAFCFAAGSVAAGYVNVAMKSVFAAAVIPLLYVAIDPFIGDVLHWGMPVPFTFEFYQGYLRSEYFHLLVLKIFIAWALLKLAFSGKLSERQVGWRNLLRKQGYYPPVTAPGAQAEISSAKQS
ncbi:hypothetical protein B9Z51_07110 [Limnohabitans sp. T6-5]|uniref:hypothetical protein n=1 Tax=Limnohabitans sp. T6-5 TaxID=1100724 RepID=UPI000D379D60|nr:hypothetical protein [Limnohabitans sp. T6-5]PUE08708.1 hypothetical protein B9Z51_07110 [Limnohabitans sp. T6-5]